MGYAINLKSVRRMEPYLKALAQATANLEWKVPDAAKVVYRLQEAVAAAKELEIKPYDALRDKWSFKLNKKGDTITAQIEYDSGSMPAALIFANVSDSMDVIEIIIRNKTVEFDLLFPDLIVIDEMLSEYCLANNYDISAVPAGTLIKRIKPESIENEQDVNSNSG